VTVRRAPRGAGSERDAPRDLRVRHFSGLDGRDYAALWFTRRTGRTSRLTDAEREVAEMILAGLSNEAIANVRRVTKATVATQVRSVFARFGVSSRAELIGRLAGRLRHGFAR
jgi:DNA-binding CsgD family transcriptional regulator